MIVPGMAVGVVVGMSMPMSVAMAAVVMTMSGACRFVTMFVVMVMAGMVGVASVCDAAVVLVGKMRHGEIRSMKS
jgi:hypothetical protein